MKNRLLLVLVAVLIVGCADKVEMNKALQDPITLNLVKQSIGDSMYLPQPPGGPEYVDNYFNSCSLLSRLKTSCALFFHPSATGTYREISCDALDLRLKNLKINISSAVLVGYYMYKQDEAQEKADNQRIKNEATARQMRIENMANGQ